MKKNWLKLSGFCS